MIINSRLKEAFRQRKKIFGAWTSLGHPSITEIFSQTGVDFVGIDLEHSTINLEQSQRIIAASHAGGTCCLPRIASHNEEMIKRLLDSGADGVIAPMVNTPVEVENLIQWVKYPPTGGRSFGIARAQDYGFEFDSYAQSWNKNSLLIVQIESATGVENLERILKFEEVDGVMVGPYDLSGSLGIPGQLEHPQLLETTHHIISTCAKVERSCGTQIIEPDSATIEAAFGIGYTFSVLASDIFLIWKWSENMRALIKQNRPAP